MVPRVLARLVPKGHFAVRKDEMPEPCPRGTFNPNEGSVSNSSCEICPLGKYGNSVGLVSSELCVSCVPGKYQKPGLSFHMKSREAFACTNCGVKHVFKRNWSKFLFVRVHLGLQVVLVKRTAHLVQVGPFFLTRNAKHVTRVDFPLEGPKVSVAFALEEDTRTKNKTGVFCVLLGSMGTVNRV